MAKRTNEPLELNRITAPDPPFMRSGEADLGPFGKVQIDVILPKKERLANPEQDQAFRTFREHSLEIFESYKLAAQVLLQHNAAKITEFLADRAAEGEDASNEPVIVDVEEMMLPIDAVVIPADTSLLKQGAVVVRTTPMYELEHSVDFLVIGDKIVEQGETGYFDLG